MLNKITTALVLALALPSAACAQGQAPRTQGSCPDERVRPAIGLDGIRCDGCRIRSHRDPDGPPITFREPPLIDGIIPGSVADGLLQAGDVLLAIDGVSIVGRAGGYAFDAIRPHVPVRFTIERDGRRRDVILVPGLRCHEPDPDDDDDDEDGPRRRNRDRDRNGDDDADGDKGEEEEDPR